MKPVLLLPSSGQLSRPIPQTTRPFEWWRLPHLAFARALGLLREWRRRSRDRAQLAALDDRMLRDIGVSRGDVLAEIDKPFWRK